MKTNRHTEDYSFEHVRQRALERYGIEIDRGEYLGMNHEIQLGLAQMVSEEVNDSDIQRVYVITIQDVEVKAVFSENRQRVTTLLPKE